VGARRSRVYSVCVNAMVDGSSKTRSRKTKTQSRCVFVERGKQKIDRPLSQGEARESQSRARARVERIRVCHVLYCSVFPLIFINT